MLGLLLYCLLNVSPGKTHTKENIYLKVRLVTNYSLALVAVQVGSKKLKPTVPTNTPNAIAKLMESCWEWEPKSRPSMEYICTQFENLT